MTDTDELRRLAEQAIAAGSVAPMLHPQAILDLLDEREEGQNRRYLLAHNLDLAERRVTALEEGLRAVIASAEDVHCYDEGAVGFDFLDEDIAKARALLDPAVPPSVLVDEAPERAEGYHAPAALPAVTSGEKEVGE